MKIKPTLLLAIFSLFIISCSSTKGVDTNKLYNSTWELEYITGPRITFNGLYPDKRPVISFDKAGYKVTGNNSCNSYSANYTLKGSSISFEDPEVTTMMFCGEGENVFLKTMKKINKYSFDKDGKLNLMMDNIEMMRFKKIDTQ